MLRFGNPKTEHLGWCSSYAKALDQARIESSTGVSTGDPGSADAIRISLRQLGDLLDRTIRRIRSRDEYRFDPRLFHVANEGFGFERGNIGDKETVSACFGSPAHEPGARDDDIRIGEDADGDAGVPLTKGCDELETVADAHARREGSPRRCLDHTSVGDRIGEGNADLDHVRPRRDDSV